MVLGLEASSVSDSTPLLDSDDLMQTLWLFPIAICWQGHSFFSLLIGELVVPLLNLSILFRPFLT
jgi:hypothetical protein